MLVSLVIRSNTWIKDSHGLFDYGNSKVSKVTINVNSPSYIVRSDQEVFKLMKPISQPELRYLVQVKIIEGILYVGNFAICPALLEEDFLQNPIRERV